MLPSIRAMIIKRIVHAHGSYSEHQPEVKKMLMRDEFLSFNKRNLEKHGSWKEYRKSLGINKEMPEGVSCKRCGWKYGIEFGTLKDGTPRYFCASCGGCYADNGKPVWGHYTNDFIDLTEELYYELGNSYEVAEALTNCLDMNPPLHATTVYRWIKKLNWETKNPVISLADKTRRYCRKPKTTSEIREKLGNSAVNNLQYLKRTGVLKIVGKKRLCVGKGKEQNIWKTVKASNSTEQSKGTKL